jgi:two-component system sensor histidine kinase/response regulator
MRPRVAAIYTEQNLARCRQTDRLLAGLMLVQWIAGIGVALWVSPYTWAGSSASIHLHVGLAILLGGLITAFPVVQAVLRPGSILTRHSLAVGQMMWSALLIHLTGGRIETHFHVFGSLAFIAFYRDYSVLVSATMIVVVDHIVRGIYYPESVFGVLAGAEWRWVEHAGWVVFEDIILVRSIQLERRSQRLLAQRQADLEETVASVEATVRHRTRELELARDEALKASQLKSTFLASMSHELRTPMNGVLGCLELLRDEIHDPHQGELLQTARDSGQSLLVLLNDLLDFSKIEAGMLRFEALPIELSPCLRRCCEPTRMLLAPTPVAFSIEESGAEGVWVMGDPIRLCQVLTNLLSNAVKFTQSGKITVGLSVSAVSDAQVSVAFSVRDTGLGIPAERQARIFEAFEQADSSTTRRFGGTGLGLAICRQLVEGMGGSLTLQSAPDSGSTFTVRLLMTRTEPIAESGPEAELSAIPCRILVAEDHPVNQRIIAMTLERMGITSDIVSNGHQVVEAAATGRYDLILMDCEMPELDGFTATRQIREREPPGRRIPIIALTARGLDSDRLLCEAAGMDDYATKPFTRETLQRILRRWLPEVTRVA